ncbi:MAG: HEAT repeat domain-containing protein [Nanoarchaeota archaeon]|nr:HEAT repeat domain-containing protein [Nanoarchaeota archaeon]
MKKRVKKELCIGFFLLVFFLVNLIINTSLVSAQFNKEDPRTWESASDLELKLITSEDIFLHYTGYKDLTERLWLKFSENARNRFIEAEAEKLSKLKIKSDLAKDGLILQNNVILNNKGGVFDLTNAPEGLEEIGYENEKFVYKFSSGGTVKMSKGGYGKEGIHSTETILDTGVFKFTGEGVAEPDFDNKKIKLDNGVELFLKNINYKQLNANIPGYVDFVSGTRAVVKTIEAKGDYGSIKAYNNPILAVFDEEPISEDYSQQFARVTEKQVNFYGDDITIAISNNKEKVVGTGVGRGVTISDGDSEIKFIEDKIKFPRTVKDFKYNIDEIKNEKIPENVFKIIKSITGESYLFHNSKRVVAGKIYYTSPPDPDNPKGSPTNSVKIATQIVTSMTAKGYMDNIPEGLSREEFIEYLKNSDDWSLLMQINSQLKEPLDERIRREAIEAIAHKGDKLAVDKLKELVKKANDWGLIEFVSPERVDELVKQSIESGVTTIENGLDWVVGEKKAVKENINSLTATAVTEGYFGVKLPPEYGRSIDSATETAGETSSPLDDIIYFRDMIRQVQEQHQGIFPRSEINFEQIGSVGIISITPIKNIIIIEGDERREVKKGNPVQFTVDSKTSRLLRNKIIDDNPLLKMKMYNKYKGEE